MGLSGFWLVRLPQPRPVVRARVVWLRLQKAVESEDC